MISGQVPTLDVQQSINNDERSATNDCHRWVVWPTLESLNSRGQSAMVVVCDRYPFINLLYQLLDIIDSGPWSINNVPCSTIIDKRSTIGGQCLSPLSCVDNVKNTGIFE